MKVTIVIPTYNERENIRVLMPKIFDVFKRFGIDGNIIVVDDNSPDKTSEEVKKLQSSYPIRLVERSKKLGLGSAYIVGFKEALEQSADLIFEMDADLSHDPDEIPKFIKKLEEGYDVVVGSRLVGGGRVIGWGLWRKLVSFWGNFIGKSLVGIDVSDLTSGYRVYKGDVLRSIELDDVKSKSYDFQLEMLARVIRKGLSVGAIPIVFHDRVVGTSKLSKRDILSFLLTAVKIRLNLI